MLKKSLILMFCLFMGGFAFSQNVKYAVVISANMEWKSVKKNLPGENYQNSEWGEFFFKNINGQNVLFFHEGWGKVSAAAATQYVIDKYKPEVLINLGTCGGIEGKIDCFEVVLVNKTIIYDIKEAMGDSKEAIADYSTNIDLAWIGKEYPQKVRTSLLVSGDRDLVFDEIDQLKKEYGAVAGDWESGAIAYVAQRNKVKVLILRGVSDIVSDKKGEAYGNFNLFAERADKVMTDLLQYLPKWIDLLHSLQK